MADESAGVGAEVGVRKIEDGNVTETRGSATPSRWAYAVTLVMLVLSIFGVWQIIEIIMALL